jgi:hypothetical protein
VLSYQNQFIELPGPWRMGCGFALGAVCGGLFTSASAALGYFNLIDLGPASFFLGTGVAGSVGAFFWGRGWRTATIFGVSFASFPLVFMLIAALAYPIDMSSLGVK